MVFKYSYLKESAVKEPLNKMNAKLQTKYVKGVPFVNRRYTKGVRFLSKMVHKRVRRWTSGQSLPVQNFFSAEFVLASIF